MAAQRRSYPCEILAVAWQAIHALRDEISGNNPRLKAISEPWRKVRNNRYLWFRAAKLICPILAFTAALPVR